MTFDKIQPFIITDTHISMPQTTQDSSLNQNQL